MLFFWPVYEDWLGFARVCLVSATFICVVCALILLPSLLLYPAHSVLLRWPITTTFGAFAGSIFYTAYFLLGERTPSVEWLAFCFGVGMLAGAVTGLSAALFVRRYLARTFAGA
jgi:hypothetical protein